MQLLTIGPEYVQAVIKSEKAKEKLGWLSSDELTSEQLAEYNKKSHPIFGNVIKIR